MYFFPVEMYWSVYSRLYMEDCVGNCLICWQRKSWVDTVNGYMKQRGLNVWQERSLVYNKNELQGGGGEWVIAWEALSLKRCYNCRLSHLYKTLGLEVLEEYLWPSLHEWEIFFVLFCTFASLLLPFLSWCDTPLSPANQLCSLLIWFLYLAIQLDYLCDIFIYFIY